MASELLAVETIEETEIDPTQPGVSWAAIAAGAVAAAALSLLLIAFGAGLGLSAVSPWSDSGVSASTFSIGTGIYLCIVAVMSSAIGGYLAGRMRTKITGLHTNEVFFRDTAHGFLAWALASVLDGPAESDPELRNAVARNQQLPTELAMLVGKVHQHAYRVTTEDVAAAQRGVREVAAIGVPDIPVVIENIATWRAEANCADRFTDGRVFLAGDAVHVVPPNGGYGGNTGVQDAHNLAWKLALTLAGVAGPGLLDTYDAERRPVGELTVEQAFTRYVTRVAPYLGTENTQPIVDDFSMEIGYRYDSPPWCSSREARRCTSTPASPRAGRERARRTCSSNATVDGCPRWTCSAGTSCC